MKNRLKALSLILAFTTLLNCNFVYAEGFSTFNDLKNLQDKIHEETKEPTTKKFEKTVNDKPVLKTKEEDKLKVFIPPYNISEVARETKKKSTTGSSKKESTNSSNKENTSSSKKEATTSSKKEATSSSKKETADSSKKNNSSQPNNGYKDSEDNKKIKKLKSKPKKSASTSFDAVQEYTSNKAQTSFSGLPTLSGKAGSKKRSGASKHKHTGKWVTTKKATCKENGRQTFKCTTCGKTITDSSTKKKTRIIKAKEHSYILLTDYINSFKGKKKKKVNRLMNQKIAGKVKRNKTWNKNLKKESKIRMEELNNTVTYKEFESEYIDKIKPLYYNDELHYSFGEMDNYPEERESELERVYDGSVSNELKEKSTDAKKIKKVAEYCTKCGHIYYHSYKANLVG